MESYEKRSDEAESEVDRLEEESERVGHRIEEAKSDWQSKQGQVPGAQPADPADPHGAAEAEEVPAEAEEAAEEGDEPSTTSVD